MVWTGGLYLLGSVVEPVLVSFSCPRSRMALTMVVAIRLGTVSDCEVSVVSHLSTFGANLPFFVVLLPALLEAHSRRLRARCFRSFSDRPLQFPNPRKSSPSISHRPSSNPEPIPSYHLLEHIACTGKLFWSVFSNWADSGCNHLL